MAFTVYMNFNGNCREAVAFYAKAFGLEMPKLMLYADAPPNPADPIPAGSEHLVMYAALPVAGANLMFCDMPPGMEYVLGNNISPVVSSTDKQALQGWFEKLGEGGAVMMALQQTFWSPQFGMVRDPFGVTWQLSYDDGRPMNF